MKVKFQTYTDNKQVIFNDISLESSKLTHKKEPILRTKLKNLLGMTEQKQFFVNAISCHFNLRNPKIDKPTPIYMVVRLQGKQYKYSLGVKIIPSQWDKKKERPFISPYLTKLDNKNNQIAFNKILEYITLFGNCLTYIYNNPTSEVEILKMLNKNFSKNMTKRNKRNALIDMGNLVDAQRMGAESKRMYLSEVKSFSSFIKEEKDKTILYWDEITLSLLTDYKSWLNRQQVKHKITQELVHLEDNTIIDKVIKIYTVLTYAEQQELIDLRETKLYKLKEKRQKRDKVEENQIYLTAEELATIRNLTLPKELESVRDLFCFQTEVGQRYEDINGCNPVILNNKIKIYQKKTKKFIHAPLTPLAQEILNKYGNVLPNIAIQKANKQIKEIAKRADINYRVEVCESRGGNPYRYMVEAWQLVGTHTARRSFISNGLKNTDSNVLRKITGHNTDSAFCRYNRIDSEDAADVIINNKIQVNQTLAQVENKLMGNTSFDFLEQKIREKIILEQEKEQQAKQIKELEDRLKYSNDFADVFSISDYVDQISKNAEEADQDDIFIYHQKP